MPSGFGRRRLWRDRKFLTQIGFGEFLAQMFGGIPMSQGEFVRLSDFGLTCEQIAAHRCDAMTRLVLEGNTPPTAPVSRS